MKLGTHNSMTYLPPKKWYLYPFRFIARCQSKDILEQYNLGARLFDLRVSFDVDNTPEFRHGLMAYKGDVEDTLKRLNDLNDKIYINLALEVIKNNSDLERQETLFKFYCNKWEKEYTNLKFFLGRRKFDWGLVYKFKTNAPSCVCRVSSTNGNLIDDLCPWIYAKRYTKKAFDTRDKNKWLFIDFIELI